MEYDAQASALPPMSNLNDIFADIVRRAPDVLNLARKLSRQRLRVATMCSGTESPLLALRMMMRAIEAQHDTKIDVEHVFSCEIEPFKQAYIQRNFAPSLLFRDVFELGNDQAHTVYGALADVPGDVDLLVAGTSCVDFSRLNKHRKGIDEGGESGRTFFGMLGWVKRHKPAFILLENVVSAPWESVAEHLQKTGYRTMFDKTFDTRNYYIPHTRRRGYLFAWREGRRALGADWLRTAQALKRPASSPFHEFLLRPDDPRLLAERRRFASADGGRQLKLRVDWAKCRARHERAREEEMLGNGRPYTRWEEGGSCSLSHGAWNDWGQTMSERVLDLLDISYLRFAKKGVDLPYKRLLIELGQNVDRRIWSTRAGVSSCIVPKGCPYLLYEGRPLMGIEALALQGLPIDELNLTREDDNQLLDLAGNAMSSTVVGACILAALVEGRHDLRSRGNAQSVSKHIAQVRSLETSPKGLSDAETYRLEEYASVDLHGLLAKANASSKRCTCESLYSNSTSAIYRCTTCLCSVCATCKSRPEHEYVLDDRERASPAAFLCSLRDVLPMRFTLHRISRKELERQRTLVKGIDDVLWARWVTSVANAVSDKHGLTFYFSGCTRDRHWSVHYRGYRARAELILDPYQPHWHVYVEPPVDASIKSRLRALLHQPVLRLSLKPTDGKQMLLEGEWMLRLPSKLYLNATIRMYGCTTTTWEAELGLQGTFAESTRFTKMDVKLAPNDDCDVSGTYELKSSCGTAAGSLFSRSSSTNAPMFFFLASTWYGEADKDRFVFSTNVHDTSLTDANVSVLACGPQGWKPPKPTAKRTCREETLKLVTEGKWIAMRCIRTKRLVTEGASLRMMTGVPLTLPKCTDALRILTISVPLAGVERIDWPLQAVSGLCLDANSYARLAGLAWLLERVTLPTCLATWSDIHGHSWRCKECAPSPATIRWLVMHGKAPYAIEDTHEASVNETSLRRRSEAFVVETGQKNGFSSVQIGCNAVTLAHRAAALLPPSRILSDGSLRMQ